MAKRKGKGKGKVHKVISDEKRQAIVVAAATAQKTIRKANMVFAIVFVLAIAYLLVRSAHALLAGADLTAEVEPEPFSMPVAGIDRVTPLTASIDDPLTLSDRGALNDAGLDVRRADELDRERETEQNREPEPQVEASAAQRREFRDRLAEAEKALHQDFDYMAAVQKYEQALRVKNIPTFEREQAQRGLDRARVYLTVTRDVVPLRTIGRFVEYQPPAGNAFTAVVPRSEPWKNGSVTVTRLDDGTVLDLRLSASWGVGEIVDPADIDDRMAHRLETRLKRLKAKKESGLVSPLDLCRAAVAILETGDVSRGGRELAVQPLAHACLGEAWDMCEKESCSLADTVLLRRDPTYQLFVGSLTMMQSLERRIADSETSAAEKAVLQDELRQHVEVADRSLRNLLRRFPGAWDFRGHRSDGLLAELRKKMIDEADRAAEREGVDLDGGETVIEPPDESVSDTARYYLDKGEQTLEEGYAIVRATRAPDYHYGNLRGDLQRALEKFRQAHEYLRRAREEAPGNRRIESLMTECRRAIHDAQKMMPIGASDRR